MYLHIVYPMLVLFGLLFLCTSHLCICSGTSPTSDVHAYAVARLLHAVARPLRLNVHAYAVAHPLCLNVHVYAVARPQRLTVHAAACPLHLPVRGCWPPPRCVRGRAGYRR